MPDVLVHEGLDPLFVPAPRSGVVSAWYGHVPFAYWIVTALRPNRIVELGTHNGVSYAAFCDAVSRAGLDTRCFAIDTWQRDNQSEYDETIYRDLRTFNDSRFAAFSELVRATFDQARDSFEDGSIDLLHIDGGHSYEAMCHDFDHWRPKLSSKAVVLFHDTNLHEQHFGVWRFWAELQQSYPHFEFLHEHGLGVLAVGHEVPDAVLRLCNLSDPSDIARVRSRFAFSGRCCILEADAARLRNEAAGVEQTRAELERLSSQLDDTRDALLMERESAQAAIQALRQSIDQIRTASSKEVARLSFVAKAQEKAAAQLRSGPAVTPSQPSAPQAPPANGRLERTSLTVTEARLTEQIRQLEHHLRAIEQSTVWRMTWPLRAIVTRLPKLHRAMHEALRALWWVVTPQRIPGRLRARRALRSLDPSARAELDSPGPPPMLVDRLSLDHIPPLHGDYTAALDWYDPVEPDVSIVVLNWNRSEMTLLCLQHLWQRTVGYRYEVIVVDNGSAPEEVAFLQNHASLARIITLKENRYFGEANNIGVEAARGRYVCFLNNDAFVHEGWLAPLIGFLETDPHTGAVGPRFLYPDGRLQEAGALVNTDGSTVQLGKAGDADDPAFGSVRQVDYISAACVVMRRSEFLQVLGFDLAWEPAYFEDVDLCLKLRLIGLQTVYCPHSTVTHIENATNSNAGHSLRLGNLLAINSAKFVARWEPFLRMAEAGCPQLVLSSPPTPIATATGRPRVAIFTPYGLTTGGRERTLFTIAEALRDVAEVALVTPRPVSRTRILTMGRDLDLAVDHVDGISLGDIDAHPAFDLAFVLGDEIYPPVGRLAARNVFICECPLPVEDEAHAQRVRPFWNDYDLLLTYSPVLGRHVRRMVGLLALPALPVEILSPPVPLLPLSRNKRMQILHVGYFSAGPLSKRQDILIEAFRKLVAAGVEAELHLAGALHPEAEHRAYYAGLVESASGLPVYFHTNCSAEVLRALYANSRLYWHAAGFGRDAERDPQAAELFCISLVEAMSAGCIPVVFATGGPAEVVEEGVTGFHFRTIDELCSRTQILFQNTPSEALEALAATATKAAQIYDQAAFKGDIRALAARLLAL